jgi:hypothetical protein
MTLRESQIRYLKCLCPYLVLELTARMIEIVK